MRCAVQRGDSGGDNLGKGVAAFAAGFFRLRPFARGDVDRHAEHGHVALCLAEVGAIGAAEDRGLLPAVVQLAGDPRGFVVRFAGIDESAALPLLRGRGKGDHHPAVAELVAGDADAADLHGGEAALARFRGHRISGLCEKLPRPALFRTRHRLRSCRRGLCPGRNRRSARTSCSAPTACCRRGICLSAIRSLARRRGRTRRYAAQEEESHSWGVAAF